ncbi:MAG: phage portal protein [Bryobacteraceae bacterium]
MRTRLVRILERWRGLSGLRGRSGTHVWDGARLKKSSPDWTPGATSANFFYDNPALLRGRAETEHRNNAYARRAVDALVNAACGATGINPMFKDRRTQKQWEMWSRSVDLAGRCDWPALVAAALRTVIVSGEAFIVQNIDANTEENPLRLQVLGPEYLDASHVDRDTYAGIRYAGVRPVGYWLHRQTPGTGFTTLQSVFVPAERCLHLFRPIAPGAQRGQSWLAPVLLALRELGEYLEAMLVRAKTGALFCGFVRTPDGSNPLTVDGVPTLEPGSMTRLRPSEEVEFSQPPDMGVTLDPFVRVQLRRIAAGLGLPYEILSGDHSAVTFASGRHGLIDYKRTIEAIQYGLLVPQLCEPIMRYWAKLEGAIAGQELNIDGVRWIGPTIEMLDPRMETLATINRVRAGFMSRSEAIAQLGWRAEDVDAEIAADNARADSLGLVLDTDPRKVTQQGQGQQQTQ